MTLPKTLKPKNKYELIRIGSKNDGGYLCTFNSVKQSATLISLGISTNWEFEKEFLKIKKNKVNFFPVDDRLNLIFIIKCIYKDFGKLLFYSNIKSIFKSIYIFFDYIFFIQKFIKKSTVDYFFLNNLIKKKKLNNIFLKIDIEGSEYRILDEIIKNKNNINCIIIEFHDVDLHIKRIVNFIKNLRFYLTHIHANNFGGTDNNGDPKVLEVTFEKKPKIINVNEAKQPHKLDSQNNPEIKDIKLIFKDTKSL
jgi:hypothetical protein